MDGICVTKMSLRNLFWIEEIYINCGGGIEIPIGTGYILGIEIIWFATFVGPSKLRINQIYVCTGIDKEGKISFCSFQVDVR